MEDTTVVFDLGMEIGPDTVWPEYPMETETLDFILRQTEYGEDEDECPVYVWQETQRQSANLLVECPGCNVDHATNFHPVRPGLTLVEQF